MSESKQAKTSSGSKPTFLKKLFRITKSGKGGDTQSTNHSTTPPASNHPILVSADTPSTNAAPRGNVTPAVFAAPQDGTPSESAVMPSPENEAKPLPSSDGALTRPDAVATGSSNLDITDMTVDRDIVMVVMGPTGVGKTTFIDSFSETYPDPSVDSHIGHDLGAGTKDVRVVTFKLKEAGANLVLVDTPGFDDADRPNSDVLKCIADHLAERYRKKEFLNGLVYLHRITDVRFDAGASTALNIFRKLYGTEGYDKLALVTTMWNDIRPEMKHKYEEKEEELKQNAWGAFLKRADHALVARYDSTTGDTSRATALGVVTDLMRNHMTSVTKSDLRLRIQVELVDENKALPRTEAGKAAFTLAETAKYYIKSISS